MTGVGLAETATVARVHDVFLGGKESYAVDRTVVSRLGRVSSGLRDGARASRAFEVQAIAALAAAGVDQFIDLGCGYPHAPNVHEIAQRLCPEARVVYADNDPAVLVHARALLGRHEGVGVAFADACDVHELLTHPVVQRLIDPGRPVAVLLAHLLEFVDDPTAARLLDALAGALPAGSRVLLTHVTPDLLPPVEAGELAETASLYSGFVAPYRLRSIAAVTDLMHRYQIVPPGVVQAPEGLRSRDESRAETARTDTRVEWAAPVVAAIGCVGDDLSVAGRQEEVVPGV